VLGAGWTRATIARLIAVKRVFAGAIAPRTHQNGATTPGYLSLRDAATWSGVSVRTLKRWIVSGLPVYRAVARGKVLIRPADIDAFLTKQQAPRPDLSRMENS
jgi:hypothetical protein